MGLRSAVRSLVRWVLRSVSLASEKAAYLFGYRAALSGVNVTDDSALESSAYFAGIRNVSEDLATLPLISYRRVDDLRRERDPDFYLYGLLHDQPNEEMDAVQFIEATQAWLMMRRNAYAEIVRSGSGRCTALWPIHPARVCMERMRNEDGTPGSLVYRVTLPDGQKDPRTGEPYSVLDRSRMFHLRAMALDGISGLSSIDTHREAIGLTLALERYGAAFFGNDATPGGVYEVPGPLSDEAYKRMKVELEAPSRGIEQAHRLKLLEEGMKFHETSVPNDKAQFNESKRFQVEEMARINRIAPHKVGDLSRATFANIEHQGIDYVVSTIRTHAARWEKAILTQLYLPADRRTHYTEFLMDALLRGDSAARAAAFQTMRQNGVINADEWRRLENMNPIEDGSGKAYLVNGNMIPVSDAGRARPAPQQQPLDAARVFRPLFLAVAERVLRKEAVAVGKAIERELPKGVRALEAWVTEFYRGDQASTIKGAFVPLAVSVGEALRGESGPDLGGWAADYAQTVAASRFRAVADEIRARVTSSEPGVRLRELVDGWKDEPARMADRELSAMTESLQRYLARSLAA